MIAQPKISRRGWLAWFLQKRRRARLATAILPDLVVSLAGSILTATRIGTEPSDQLTVQSSSDGVAPWISQYDLKVGINVFVLTGWPAGYYRMCYELGEDEPGEPYSNAVFYPG